MSEKIIWTRSARLGLFSRRTWIAASKILRRGSAAATCLPPGVRSIRSRSAARESARQPHFEEVHFKRLDCGTHVYIVRFDWGGVFGTLRIVTQSVVVHTISR